MRGKLTATIGCPRSGKSTYCSNWLQKCERRIETGELIWVHLDKSPRVIVCADDFRMALYNEAYKKEFEAIVWFAVDLATKALLNRGHDVILDETCSTDISVRRVLQMDGNAEFVWFDTPPEVCKERAVATKQEYLIPVIDRVWGQMQKLKVGWNENLKRWREEFGR